jgi:hypothetical protein
MRGNAMHTRESFPELLPSDEYEATGKSTKMRDWGKVLRVLAASFAAGLVVVVIFRVFGAA